MDFMICLRSFWIKDYDIVMIIIFCIMSYNMLGSFKLSVNDNIICINTYFKHFHA